MKARAADASVQALYCPLPTARQREKGLRSGKLALTAIGLECRCHKCQEYWPADTEFFYSTLSKGLHCWCKACYVAWRYVDGDNGWKQQQRRQAEAAA